MYSELYRKQPFSETREYRKCSEGIYLWKTRILYIWHTRHPSSGYVQGINDIVTPFIIVFLNEHIPINFETV